MLSYQHAYHAGCLADVHKHAALSFMLEACVAAYPQLTYLESHAGRGEYQLNAPEAKKTREAEWGITHVLKAKPALKSTPFYRALMDLRGKAGRDAYPGSPWLAKFFLRPTDNILLHELHPQEYAALGRNMRRPSIRLFKEDGLQGVVKRLPVKGAALAVIDPSFEVKEEYLASAETLIRLWQKSKSAMVLLWYPLLAAGHHVAMHAALQKAGLPYTTHEVEWFAKDAVRGMYGSGLVLVNVPDAVLKQINSLNGLFSQIPLPVLPAPKALPKTQGGKPASQRRGNQPQAPAHKEPRKKADSGHHQRRGKANPNSKPAKRGV